jgi:diadenosine tetraphosphate (Ap4A) HIT family hydrolase
MRSGAECGMCADASLETNEFSDLVAELDHSHLRLARNQTHPGYCLVIFKRHASELFELTPAELGGFWADVAAAARAVAAVFEPVKFDYLVMGHRMPHLHCHVYPQYAGNDPFRNVDISEGDLTLAPAERVRVIADLRVALANAE